MKDCKIYQGHNDIHWSVFVLAGVAIVMFLLTGVLG
jgi:hypothetical protein